MDPLNPFAALDDMMMEACDMAFAIRVRLEPQTAPGSYGEGAPDPDRPAADVRGILSSAPKLDGIGGQGTDRTSGPGKVSGQTVVIGLSAATLRALPWRLRVNDGVVLPDVTPPNPTRYRITRLLPTDMGDLELLLNEA